LLDQGKLGLRVRFSGFSGNIPLFLSQNIPPPQNVIRLTSERVSRMVITACCENILSEMP
jgi:hypothetical protein